jgi:TolA-binding protein
LLVDRPTWAQTRAGRSPQTESAVETETPSGNDDASKSTPEALSAYSQAATFQNNRAFDLAAEAWQKFLKTYADDPRAVDAHYNLGVCYLELKLFTQARAALQRALATGKEFSRRQDAFLNLGWATYSLALQDKAELFPQAEQTFAKLLEEYPDGTYSDQALFLLGESLYMQGKRAEAAQSYERLVKDYPDSDLLANGLYALGVSFEEQERFAEAGQMYDRFLSRFAEHALVPEVRMRKAETLLQSGDLPAAERLFEEVGRVRNFPEADHARYRQAYCVARQERFADAAELFVAITRDFPKSRYREDAAMAAARAYYRAEQDDNAAKWFDRLLKVSGPASFEAAHWRARLLLKKGQPDAALKLVDGFLSKPDAQEHPFYANLRLDQADAIYELPERKQQAMELYLRLARDDAKHILAPQALYNAAFAQLELKDYRGALQLAQEFLKTYADHRLQSDVKQVIAECQLQLGDSGAAAETFGELAAASGDTEAKRLQLRQAVALYMQKKYEETLTQLTAQFDSFTTDDQRAEALYLMGMSYFAQEKFPEAAQALVESLEIQPRWRQADEALLYLSRAQRRLGENAEAKAAAQRLLEEFPQSALRDQATLRLGESLYAMEDYAAAIEQYEELVRHWPDSSFVPYAFFGWGWSLLRQAKYDEAQAVFERLLTQFPTHALARSSLYGRALGRQQAGQFQAALDDLQQFLKQEPDRREKSDAMYVQGLCLIGLKQHDRAINVLQALLQQDADYEAGDKVLYELAWAYEAVKQPEQSLAAFRQLAEQYPDKPFAAEALYHLGEASYEQDKFDEAIQSYQKARALTSGTSELSEKVRYKLGWALYQSEQLDAARAAFAEQLQLAPDGQLSGDALFMQAECLFKQGKYEPALPLYTQARQRSLSSEQITTLAYLHAGQAAAQLQRWKDSLEWLTELAKKYPESPSLMQTDYELAVAQQNLGNVDDAERLFRSVADRASGELAARARFMLGEVLYAKQDYATAIREFRKVMFGFDPALEPQVAPWQAKAGVEAGQCAGILASQKSTRSERQQFVELAANCFQYVLTRHAGTDEASAATEQLKKYGRKPQ